MNPVTVTPAPFSLIPCDDDTSDVRAARVQSLCSRLEQHFSDAVPIGSIIQLAWFVIFKLPDLQKKGTFEYPRKKFDLLCTVRNVPETNFLFFFPKDQYLPKDQKAVYGANRVVKTALCLLPNQGLIRIKKVVPQKPTLKFHNYLKVDNCIFSDPGLKDAKGIPKAYGLFSYRWKHLHRHMEYASLDERVCAIRGNELRTTEKFCLMMEHFDGGLRDLLTLLQQGEIPPLSFRERASIIRQMVEAVHTLHTHVDEDGAPDPIAHYAIEPANFLFRIERTEKGGRKFCIAICDFGLHCHVCETPDEDDEDDVRQWYINKTHLYPYAEGTAPELLNEPVVHKNFLTADIWALGYTCLQLFVSQDATYLYQILKEVRNHNRREAMTGLLKVARKAVVERSKQLIKSAQQLYPQERPLIEAIERMLEPNPRRRISLEDLKQGIERVVVDFSAH